jgi:hypothetical protein
MGAFLTISHAAPLTGVQWIQIGPAPEQINAEQNFQGAGPDSGQVFDMAIDPRGTSDQVLYIATEAGGIWKSTNGGSTWTPQTDFMPSLSMGAVALDAGNPSVVYAGTGNGPNQGFFKAVGIYKSSDAGQTWTVLNPNGIFTAGGGSCVFNSVDVPNGRFNGFNGNAINRIVSPSAKHSTRRDQFRAVALN